MSQRGALVVSPCANVNRVEVIREGVSVSPSVLANRITQSSRNAWCDLWIKRPGDKDWTLAEDFRNPSPSVGPGESMVGI